MNILITGSAGFIGSHLVDRFLKRGETVVGLDNYLSGQRVNTQRYLSHPNFTFIEADVAERIPYGQRTSDVELDWVLHFASPASPPHYQEFPLQTLMVGAQGTHRALEMAQDFGAQLIFASTSEVYGDPLIHPQPESYWGNVNPIGPRACYDEAKRYAEAAVSSFRRKHGIDARIIRIFNTYGPRMRLNDGRVVTNFIRQALRGEPLTIYGDGMQTRSFQYVDDLVDGIESMMASDLPGPVNLGNPREFTVKELAETILDLTGSRSKIVYEQGKEDDPRRRQPDITLAMTELDWDPKVALRDGLDRTIAYVRTVLDADDIGSEAKRNDARDAQESPDAPDASYRLASMSPSA